MKSFLAIVAALCAFAAVATSAAPQPEKSVGADLLNTILDTLSNLLSDIEKTVAEFESNAKNAEQIAEDRVQEIMNGITVEPYVDWAHEQGLDVTHCTDPRDQGLEKITEDCRALSKKCVAKYIGLESIAALKDVDAAARALLQETKDKVVMFTGVLTVEVCKQQGNFLTYDVCLAKNLIPISVKAASMALKISSLQRKAGFPASVLVLAKECGSVAFESNRVSVDTLYIMAVLCITKDLQ